MNPDDRIRDAYRNLTDRVSRDIDPATTANPASNRANLEPTRPWSGLLARPGLAIAGLVVAAGVGAVAIGLSGGGSDDDQQVATDAVTSTTADVTATLVDGSTDADGDGAADDGNPDDDQDDPGGTNDGDGPDELDGQRFRVATERVAADAADPFLNMRADPDARSDLMAKLPAGYTGMLAIGPSETAADGGTWLPVELLNPVTAAGWEFGDERPRGWVNAAFVEPLPDGLAVGTDELAACDDDLDGFGVDGSLGSGHVAAIESGFLTETCLRVIVTFGSGQAPFGWLEPPDGGGPVGAVPSMITMSSGGFGTTIDLGPIRSTWNEATETNDGVYLARSSDGTLDLVSPAPANIVSVTPRPEIDAVVIDYEITGEAPPSGAGVVLTRPLSPGSGTVEVVGLSRPFEAVLGVTVEDSTGGDVEAVFSGNAQIGTLRGTSYGVATTDWTEAWGMFALRVEGLEAGDYTLVLNAEDAADDPRLLRLPFSLDEGGDAPTPATGADQDAAMALIRFARGGDPTELPLANEVALLLGPRVDGGYAADQLADRDAWTIDAPEGFAEFTGPFNALELLGGDGLSLTAGQVSHCAGPPRDWPAGLAGLRQVNIEPVGIDSCIAWFGVHLFLDDDDRIAAVALDLFGP